MTTKFSGRSFALVAVLLLSVVQSMAQGRRNLGPVGTNPEPVGAEGVQWYTTWETAKAEAARSQRPIFFMAAAYECRGVTGVF